ncbi:hypothetical protein CACET_c35170 [Clostridium aceticum]|uniref:Uncharacterized protein n=1 Tax=Clostridium aceticum TaxID=84022 RepID=A0A0D8IAY6_9CLOT|nr:DUF1576 domain-containing protein [Clostridium aceticum]AKL96948.1 hypothetical protein CACET_c35170 [Clostridium aceticum]KJF27418.1 membrane protein [Clostridium aceticum]
MDKSVELKVQTNEGNSQGMAAQKAVVDEKVKYGVVSIYAVLVLLSAFAFNSPYEIITGMRSIIVAPSILVTDYMAVGNIGAALFNAGLLMIIAIAIAKFNEVNMNGPVIAAILTIGGFALFGKNIYNIWAIFLGVYLHAVVKKEKFSKFILMAFFGTALGPLISQATFGFGFSPVKAVVLANVVGVIAGYVLPPLGTHFVKFHQGFNLYNIGFTAGIIGTFFMAIFRAFGLQNESTLIVLQGYNNVFGVYLIVLFGSMTLVGLLFNNKTFQGYKKLTAQSGRAVADFVSSDGFGVTLINMGIIGVMTTLYVILVKGELNGPTIGGVFTVVGFGAFGKHAKNILPILIGVYLFSLLNIWDANATGALLAALFGTTLAPIAGQFGWISGIIAGFLHMAMVMNVGYLHGGMNLYNNGFAGGIVAAALVPVLESFKSNKEE